MRQPKLLMWRIPRLVRRSTISTFLTECPMGHERTITVNRYTPEQDWTLTCPVCGGEHRIIAPEILRSDL